MKYHVNFLPAIFAILFSGCATRYNSLTIVDDSLSPVGSRNQLVLEAERGNLGQHYYPEGSSKAIEDYNYSGSGSRQWVIQNWGMPDRAYSERGVEYLIYERRSKSAPNYNMQYLGGERSVKLGYRNGKLIYIAAYFKNCESYMKGPIHVLPK
jgi:hypothetical protein